ncbi:formylglycine-generating enzyme family protein [Rubripirellula amarantea]|nr:formylglycine-generating enzyme family protein [Rubripirellula amarantea]
MKTTSILTLFIFTTVSAFLHCASIAHADTFGTGANQFDIEFVAIGDPDNPDDTTGDPNPGGKVEYAYRMGKFEISEDMIDKANTLGGLGITHDNRGANKPATSVSWFEAATFVNWLNTSQGHTPAYKFNGSTFELWQSGDAGYNPNNLFRNSQAFYFLPSADEWYKAAYYDPNAGVYYDYPTGSGVPDGIDFAGDTTFDAVFFDGGSNPQPNDITDVGVLSPYGTAGQGGNVFEWEETEFDLVNDSTSSARGVRGGTWSLNSDVLRSSNRFFDIPTYENDYIGFRVASIPEPSTALLGALAAGGLLVWRRRLS